MIYGIVAGILFLVLRPAYQNLKKNRPDVKWDSLLLGGFLLVFFVFMGLSSASL